MIPYTVQRQARKKPLSKPSGIAWPAIAKPPTGKRKPMRMFKYPSLPKKDRYARQPNFALHAKPPKITVAKAETIGRMLGMDFSKISASILHRGMLHELEHGKKAGALNVTNDDLFATAKIALAHLSEDASYYTHLAQMENQVKAKVSK